MLRKFTKDVGRNFKAGNLRDYPLLVWKQIAKDIDKPLESFSEEVADNTQAPELKEARKRK